MLFKILALLWFLLSCRLAEGKSGLLNEDNVSCSQLMSMIQSSVVQPESSIVELYDSCLQYSSIDSSLQENITPTSLTNTLYLSESQIYQFSDVVSSISDITKTSFELSTDTSSIVSPSSVTLTDISSIIYPSPVVMMSSLDVSSDRYPVETSDDFLESSATDLLLQQPMSLTINIFSESSTVTLLSKYSSLSSNLLFSESLSSVSIETSIDMFSEPLSSLFPELSSTIEILSQLSTFIDIIPGPSTSVEILPEPSSLVELFPSSTDIFPGSSTSVEILPEPLSSIEILPSSTVTFPSPSNSVKVSINPSTSVDASIFSEPLPLVSISPEPLTPIIFPESSSSIPEQSTLLLSDTSTVPLLLSTFISDILVPFSSITELHSSDNGISPTDVLTASVFSTDVLASISSTDVLTASVFSTDILASISPTDVLTASVFSTDVLASISPTDVLTTSVFSTDVLDASISPTDVLTASVFSTDVLDASISPTDVLIASVFSTDVLDPSISPTSVFSTDVLDASISPTDLLTASVFLTDVLDASISPTDVLIASVFSTDVLDASSISLTNVFTTSSISPSSTDLFTTSSISPSSTDLFTTSSISLTDVFTTSSISLTDVFTTSSISPSSTDVFTTSSISPSSTDLFTTSSISPSSTDVFTTSSISLTDVFTTSSISPSSTDSSIDTTSSLISPSVSISPDRLQNSLVRLILQLTIQERDRLANKSSIERAELEQEIINWYLQGLQVLGRNRRQSSTPQAQVTEVGVRDSSNGETPVDFYIIVGQEPLDSSLVIGVLTRAQPQQIAGYELVEITVPTSTMTDSSIPLSAIIGSTVGGSILLIIIVIVLVTVCVGVSYHRKQKRHDQVEQFVAVDPFQETQNEPESVAIQHGTPAIDKLSRRSRIRRHQPSSSTLALLASSSEVQIDAWQRSQLNPSTEEPPAAALFEHVTHYSDLQPAAVMPSPRSLRMKFYTAIAPSPSTSNQSKVSLSSENLIKPSEIEPVETTPNEENKTMSLPQKGLLRDRMKLQSQQRRTTSRHHQKDTENLPVLVKTKEGESEGEGGLGDVEGSSHSDEAKLSLSTPRPATTKKRRRKLNSRGVPIKPVTTDGYDTTDHKTKVPPSRQSRKHRSGRNMRARPLTQGLGSSRAARNTAYDARRELAWMSTGSGVQLISIQPLESMGPPPLSRRPSWQRLPQLPSLQPPGQTYSRQQLEQLLQLHKELERVEQGGILHQRSSLTPESGDFPHTKDRLTLDSSYSAEELATQAFVRSPLQAQPLLQHPSVPMSIQSLPHTPSQQLGHQLVWSPSFGSQLVQSQPLPAAQLTQLRQNTNAGVLYPQPWTTSFH